MSISDIQKLIENDGDFERQRLLIDSRMSEYIKSHPHQWLALGEGDTWVFAQSLEALVEELDSNGLSRATALIRYLDPDPLKLVV